MSDEQPVGNMSEELDQIERENDREVRMWRLACVVTAVIGILLGSWVTYERSQSEQAAQSSQAQVDDLAARAIKACATDGEARDRLVQAGVCQKADEVATSPEAGAVPGAAGRDGVDGIDGRDGQPGPRGPVGPAGRDGADGSDGSDGA